MNHGLGSTHDRDVPFVFTLWQKVSEIPNFQWFVGPRLRALLSVTIYAERRVHHHMVLSGQDDPCCLI